MAEGRAAQHLAEGYEIVEKGFVADATGDVGARVTTGRQKGAIRTILGVAVTVGQWNGRLPRIISEGEVGLG